MEILKKFREKNGLTQTDFAKEIGVSVSFYAKIELRRQDAKQRIYK